MGRIYIYKDQNMDYPCKEFAHSPSEQYPEYPWPAATGEGNPIYGAVRYSLCKIGLDKENYGTSKWNPLSAVIKEGDTVLIKPNMVKHENEIAENGNNCLYTHPSLVRAVVDYVVLALKGTGRIIIADAPVQSCDFDELVRTSGYAELLDFFKNHDVKMEFYDLRGEIAEYDGRTLKRKQNPNHYDSICVDLGRESSFASLSEDQIKKLRITNYDPRVMNKHHTARKHEYSVSKIALEANVVINMPKIKTHRKAGITAALKNVVGVNTNKDYLPHHRLGAPCTGGDECNSEVLLCSMVTWFMDVENRCLEEKHYIFAQIFSCFRRIGQKLLRKKSPTRIMEGNWKGNDTIWRMVNDLNRILLYSDVNGKLHDESQRKMLIIGDMVIAGEGDGPLKPTPKHIGCIILSDSPIVFDLVVSKLMGFSYQDIPIINKCFMFDESVKNTVMRSNNREWDDVRIEDLNDAYDFTRPQGW